MGKVDATERGIIEQGLLPSEDGLRAFAVSLRVQHLSRKPQKLFMQRWKEDVGVPKRLVRLPLAASSVGDAALRRLLSGSRWTVISSARILTGLVEAGNTVIVIEHNLDIIASADHIIDLGPEGGRGGGKLIASGTPEAVAKNTKSFTGQYLAKLMAARRRK